MTTGLLLAALEVVAVYYPHWHRYPKGDEWFGRERGWDWSEGEWELVKKAQAKFPGHHQPLVPQAGYLKGDDPRDVAKEIALASNAGIDVFLYDYYYYDGQVTQEEALEKGFLRAANRNRMKFALMWCYHERNDGWCPKLHGEKKRLMSLAHKKDELLGFIDLSIKRYFRQPEYWRKDGKLFFSIYNAGYFRSKLGDEQAKAAIAEARQRVRTAGLGELHVNAQLIDPAKTEEFARLGFDSFTDYNIGPYFDWDNYGSIYASGVREQDYSVIQDLSRARWNVCKQGRMPYLYSVTMGWDRTPRCRQDEPYPWKGPTDCYPYETTVTNNTPDRFEALLREAKERAENDPRNPGVVYINAWNEYTEGEWLVPDNFYSDGYLRAIAAVFGRRPVDEYSFVDAWTKKLFTCPAATCENVSYGPEPRQKLDLWLPHGVKGRFPIVVYFHGGGWTSGAPVDRVIGNNIRQLLDSGVAVSAVNYRHLQDAPDAKPPVRTPLGDCEAALQLIREKADEWNIDTARIALSGGSAGAATALYLGLKDNNRHRIAAIAAVMPQTSLDPKEMREWIPNIGYGAHAFGYASFEDWLRHRDECLADVNRISAAALLRRIDATEAPRIFIQGVRRPVAGKLPSDPTHAGEFVTRFQELCTQRGVTCEAAFGDEDYFARTFKTVADYLNSITKNGR